jgi:octaprenyl-diphosphate synthase
MYGSKKEALEVISEPIADELDLFEEVYSQQFSADTALLQPILRYIGDEKGKRLRPTVFFLSQGLASRPNTDSITIAVLLELLHTATLLHDDVVDGSTERRGKRSVNDIWGNQVSVLLGDYLFAKVLALGVESQWPDVLRVVSRVVLNMGKGELRQNLGEAESRVNVEAYFQSIREKTAGLFIAACDLGGLVVDANPDDRERLWELGESFGMTFQIRDDILDYSGTTENMGKPVGQDVSNGKITLPLILALDGRAKTERLSILQKLDRGTEDDVALIHDFVVKNKGVEKAQDKARIFAERAEKILSTFNPSIYRQTWQKLVAHDLERIA